MTAIQRLRRGARRLRTLAASTPQDDERRLATSPATKIAQRQLYLQHRAAVAGGSPLPSLRDVGFRVFSQDDEDGILLFLLAVIGVGPGHFVDIGAGNCVTGSNCANLALNLGFHGLFVEGDEARAAAGRAFYRSHPDTRTYPPKVVTSFVTRDNVDDVITRAGLAGPVDVLSIDIDGNDHWIWQAVTAATANIVVIETHPEHGVADVASPYRADFDWRHAAPGEPIGASPAAMVRIGAELGYRLVGSNRYGFNAFFVREELAPALPTVAPRTLLAHAWNRDPEEVVDPSG